MADLTDFDGCRRECRKKGHTLVWGECDHAPEPPAPEPTVYIARKQIASDGGPSLWFEPVKIADLDEVRALRAELERIRADVTRLTEEIETEVAGAFRETGPGLDLTAIRDAVKAKPAESNEEALG